MKTMSEWLSPSILSRRVLLSFLTIPMGFAHPGFGQTEVSRFTLDGGGGLSETGSKRITGTIGQPDAGVLEGGSSRILGGFWPGAVLSGPPTSTPTATATETLTPTATPSFTPTLTPTPIGIYFDVKPNPLDGFIDERDLIEWVDRTRGSNGDLDVLFEFSVHWRRDYPQGGKRGSETE